jgi:hypothetical protein
MKIAIITPIPDLDRYATEGSGIHLVLAHLLGDPAYYEFYKERRAAGDYLILDNGAHEHARPLKMPELLARAERLGAHEVVLPDVQTDSVATLHELMDALYYLRFEHGRVLPKFMLVPQGSSFKTWLWSLRASWEAMSRNEFDRPVVGIAKHHNDLVEGGVATFAEAAREEGFTEIHLLGWPDVVESLGAARQRCPWIRSIDSAKPLTYAREGIHVVMATTHGDLHRADDFFTTQIPIEHERVARANIEYMRTCASGGSMHIPRATPFPTD